MSPPDRSPPADEDETGGEVLLEFAQVGSAIKVTALDPVTMVEVSIVGDPRESTEILERTAIRKLAYVLNKRTPKRAVAHRKKKGILDTEV